MSTQTDTPTDAPFDYVTEGGSPPGEEELQLGGTLQGDDVFRMTWMSQLERVYVTTTDAHEFLKRVPDGYELTVEGTNDEYVELYVK